MYPNFIVAGAAKAGTTSLYHYLSEHPQVFMSNPKEINFFSKDEIEAQGLYYRDFKVKNLEDYQKLFSNAKAKKAVGEGSVSYLFYPQTPAKIKAVIPDVKIIILLRDPVERGFSHYLMDYRLGLVDIPFEDIVYKTNGHKNLDLYYQQYIELGLYYEQVKRYVYLFGQEKVKIYLQEDLRANTKKIISDLYDFLEIDKSFIPDIEREHNVFSMPKNGLIHKLYASDLIRTLGTLFLPDTLIEKIKILFFEEKQKPKLKHEVRDYLRDLYSGNIRELERLIGRDLTNWYKEDNNE